MQIPTDVFQYVGVKEKRYPYIFMLQTQS